MSGTYIVAPAALDDIDDISAWLSQGNPNSDIDVRFIEAAYEAFECLAKHPAIGHRRSDLTNHPVLFWSLMNLLPSSTGRDRLFRSFVYAVGGKTS